MKAFTVLALAAMAAPAAAQAAGSDDFGFLSREKAEISLRDFEGGAQGIPGLTWSVGPTAGYIKARDADKASWFGGVAARCSFTDMFAGEASVVFRQDKFLDGDVKVTQYPIQLTGMFMPPLGDLRGVHPYALVGYGWYYTRTDFSGSLSGTSAETDSLHGVHVGGGAQFPIGGKMLAFVDFRYVFIDEAGVDNSNLADEEFDFWEIAFGATFQF